MYIFKINTISCQKQNNSNQDGTFPLNESRKFIVTKRHEKQIVWMEMSLLSSKKDYFSAEVCNNC